MTELYLITPPKIVLSEFIEAAKQAFDGGKVAAFQLRLKPASDDEILRAAEALLPLCQEHDAAFIINDRPDLALRTGADGVHLGEPEDGTVESARALLGEAKVIGYSCYASKHRAMEAAEAGADYVAFGQFFETQTKPAKGRPTPEILEWWTTFTEIPCVAIGGITPDNCQPLVKAGADFLAVITSVWNHAKGPKAAVASFQQLVSGG